MKKIYSSPDIDIIFLETGSVMNTSGLYSVEETMLIDIALYEDSSIFFEN